MHFTSQKETRRHLERRREENEEVLLQLKEQKELLEQQSEEIKYSGEAKLSRSDTYLTLSCSSCHSVCESHGLSVGVNGTQRITRVSNSYSEASALSVCFF